MKTTPTIATAAASAMAATIVQGPETTARVRTPTGTVAADGTLPGSRGVPDVALTMQPGARI